MLKSKITLKCNYIKNGHFSKIQGLGKMEHLSNFTNSKYFVNTPIFLFQFPPFWGHFPQNDMCPSLHASGNRPFEKQCQGDHFFLLFRPSSSLFCSSAVFFLVRGSRNSFAACCKSTLTK